MSAELSQHIKQHLLNSIQHMKAVKQCMEEEQEALQSRDVEQIQRITRQKELLLKDVESDISERQDLLQQQKLDPDDNGMEALINNFPEKVAQALHQGWSQLIALYEEVQKINQANGMIINKGLQQVDTMLGILHHNTESRTARTYNAKGRSIAPASRNTRNLGEA